MNASPLLACPATVTVTLPVVAPEGTGAVMLVAVQVAGVAVVVLNRRVLVPCTAPKFVPFTVTTWPTPPEVGASGAVSVGGGKIAGTSTRELKFPLSTPSRSNSALKSVVVDPAVMLTPAQRYRRVEDVTAIIRRRCAADRVERQRRRNCGSAGRGTQCRASRTV